MFLTFLILNSNIEIPKYLFAQNDGGELWYTWLDLARLENGTDSNPPHPCLANLDSPQEAPGSWLARIGYWLN
jgi:hypothetical protein